MAIEVPQNEEISGREGVGSAINQRGAYTIGNDGEEELL